MQDIAPAWSATSWSIGYGLGYCSVASAPISAAYFRCLLEGEIDVCCVCLSSVYDALGGEIHGAGQMTMSEVVTSLELLTMTEAKLMIEKGVKFSVVRLEKEKLLAVPAGYIIMERAKAGPKIFGFRKSAFFDLESSKASYGIAKVFYANEGKDVQKMTDILAKFSVVA